MVAETFLGAAIILGIFSGLIAAFVYGWIYTWLKRPELKIQEDRDEWNPEYGEHYAHVRVIAREGFGPFRKDPAVDCRSKIEVKDKKTKEIKGEFETKWGRVNTPFRHRGNIDPPYERRLTIYPGMHDGDKEGGSTGHCREAKGRNSRLH